jgi:hypothetical protein
MNELVQLVKVIREKCGGTAWNERDREADLRDAGGQLGDFQKTARVAPPYFQKGYRRTLQTLLQTLYVIGSFRHHFRYGAH